MVGRILQFTKSQRLASNRDFKAVLDKRYRATDGFLVLCVGPSPCGYPRLGISVGRSYGTAVQRNRLKRLVREAFRLSQFEIPSAWDYLVMPAPRRGRRKMQPRKNPTEPGALSLSKVRESFLRLVNQAVPNAK
ncbi:ribonuclease P protein component [Planctomycetota bacterium]